MIDLFGTPKDQSQISRFSHYYATTCPIEAPFRYIVYSLFLLCPSKLEQFCMRARLRTCTRAKQTRGAHCALTSSRPLISCGCFNFYSAIVLVRQNAQSMSEFIRNQFWAMAMTSQAV